MGVEREVKGVAGEGQTKRGEGETGVASYQPAISGEEAPVCVFLDITRTKHHV